MLGAEWSKCPAPNGALEILRAQGDLLNKV